MYSRSRGLRSVRHQTWNTIAVALSVQSSVARRLTLDQVVRSLYRQFPVNAITGKYMARGCRLMGFPTFCPLM